MKTINELIKRNALFVINHSGGKDSQAMTAYIKRLIPADQLLVIHADLPGVDWDGTEDHIRATIGDTPLIVCRAVKTFYEMVRSRQMFPSPKNRQCTSDLKRGPIEREIRRYLKSHPEHNGLIVNCMGMRAEESSSRAKLETFKINNRNSKAGREWYDWLPIHDWLVGKVFETIAAVGQKAFWIYAEGMSRMSCRFCIMSSEPDLKTAARLAPCALKILAALEVEVAHTMSMSQRLITDIVKS